MLVWKRQRWYLLPRRCAGTAGIAVLGHGNSASLGWFAICLLGIWCALTGERLDVLVYWVGTLILFAVEWVWIHADPGWGAWMAGSTLAVSAGLLVRHERDLVAQLGEAQAGLAERARAEERTRIARELHDVIAHTLTVSLLHVSSARLAVEHGLDDAASSLAEAERLGRESLDEVRMAVGMLHQDGNEARTRPLPDASALPGLVEQFRSAGADAALTVEGEIATAAGDCGARALSHPPGGADQLGQARARRTDSGAAGGAR